MTDNSLKTEYTVEPENITNRVALAPTMAGGIALLIDGEHIDHFRQNELEQLEDSVTAALDVLESEGHYTASERKFDRMIQEAIGHQAEIMYFLFRARQAAEEDNYNEINYDTLKRVTGMLQSKVTLIEAMAEQMAVRKEQEAIEKELNDS